MPFLIVPAVLLILIVAGIVNISLWWVLAVAFLPLAFVLLWFVVIGLTAASFFVTTYFASRRSGRRR